MKRKNYYLKLYSMNRQFVAVVYEHDGRFIACEKSSSLGFTTITGAEKWIENVCKGEPLSMQDGNFKMIPEDIRYDIENCLQQIPLNPNRETIG